jgi:hypothetical protein
MPYPWYELVAGSTLEQGDILRNCLAPIPPRIAEAEPLVAAPAGSEVPVARAAPEPGDIHDRVIVLSQSCDLAQGDIARVMVCPVYTLDEFVDNARGNRNQRNTRKGNLRSGRLIGYHLLNRCTLEGFEATHLVSDFGDAFSIPLQYAVELAGAAPRVRLLPPYREHLSQMFARFYMRVGLPIEVDPFP